MNDDKKKLSVQRLAVVFAVFLTLATLSLFAFSAAEVGKVKIVKSGSGPYISELARLPDSTQIFSLEACVPQNVLDSYYGGDVKKYKAAQAKQAACTDGYMQATVLTQKIADTEASIAEIDLRLSSLQKTREYLKTFVVGGKPRLHRLNIAAIPAGLDETRVYEQAKNINMVCLKGASTSATESSVAVGDLSTDQNAIFNTEPAGALNNLKTMFANMEQVNVYLSQITMTKPDVALFIPGVGGAVKFFGGLLGKGQDLKQAETRVTESFKSIGMALNLLMRVKETAETSFIPVTFEDLRANYKTIYDKKHYTTSSYVWAKEVTTGSGSNKVTTFAEGSSPSTRSMGKVPSNLLKIIEDQINPPIPREKMPKELTHIIMTIDGTLQVVNYIPETDVYNEFISGVSRHEARYQTMKAAHQKNLNDFQNRLNQLIANNYNCR